MPPSMRDAFRVDEAARILKDSGLKIPALVRSGFFPGDVFRFSNGRDAIGW